MEEPREVLLPWRSQPADPMEFLSRSWSASALEASKALSASAAGGGGALCLPPPPEDSAGELEECPAIAGNSFSFASSATSQLVMERIMSQSEVSPLTSGRLSHSSGPLNGGGGGSLTDDSPPVSPSEIEDFKYLRGGATPKPLPRGSTKTMGRWLKDRKERKKEETRAHNAQLHAAVSVAAVAAAVAAVAAATAASTLGKEDKERRTDAAVAQAATLVAAQCVEAAETMGAEREHLAMVVGSAVNVRTPGDVTTITAAAATALRGAATLKARALKEVWNIAAVIPVEKGGVNEKGTHNNNNKQRQRAGSKNLASSNSNGSSFSDDLAAREDDNFLGLCSQELLARGTELLKRTRKGALHWKVVSVYINRMGLVMLKMKSKHVAGTITKKKKNVVIDVCKDVASWPGRHLLEGGEQRRYFGLRTAERRVIEFECRSQREFEMWTQGVSRLLSIVNERKRIS